MLADYPILFDGEAIPWPNPDSWKEDPQTLETTAVTEAGTDQIIKIRDGKFHASGTWNCSSAWARKFREFSTRDRLTVSVFDFLSGGYAEIPCRIRGYNAALVGYSQRTGGTDGLWVVSFELIGF